MDALEQLLRALGLDYAGVDFGLSPDRDILLFEADATMAVQHPDQGERWAYRRPAIDRIHAAVRHMLMRNAGIAAPAASQRNVVPVQPALRPRPCVNFLKSFRRRVGALDGWWPTRQCR